MIDKLNLIIFGNSIKDYLMAFAIFIGLFFIFRFFRLVIIESIKKLTEKTENNFDDLVIDIISNISKFFYWFVAFYFGVKYLNTPEIFKKGLNIVFVISLAYEIVIILQQIIDYFVSNISERKDKSSKAVFHAVGKFLKWSLWIIAVLMVLSNFGINISTLAAGLGIGGLAIAFAFQSILKDLFSYFTILLDKPIRIGDYIKINDKNGTVKNIGLKTTRLQGVDGEEIIIANDLITSTDFSNFGKAKDRRVVYTIGVGYDTPVKKLKKLKEKIIKIVESFEDVTLSRCHLRTLADSSMNYEVVYHIKTRDYQLYMDINEEINLKILELFEKEKVEIPFPTRTVYNRKG